MRLAYLVSHPIQYQAPLLRRIAQEPGIDLTVLFGSDFSVRGYRDRGFGVDVKWDIPLVDGYKSEFLPVLRDKRNNSLFSPISRGIAGRLRGRRGEPAFEVLWVHGYATLNQLQGVLAAKFAGIPVLIRSDSSLRDRPRGAFKLLAKRAFFGVLRRLVDGVLVAGTWNEDYWRHYMGPDFPLFLMPYAVDNLWFQEQSQNARSRRAELQAELGLDADRPVILFASKFQARKHCDDLLEAYKRLSPAPGEDPHPYGGRRRWRRARSARAAGSRYGIFQYPLLRLPQPVGVATFLRPLFGFCLTLAPRALGPHRQRSHERVASSHCLGRRWMRCRSGNRRGGRIRLPRPQYRGAYRLLAADPRVTGDDRPDGPICPGAHRRLGF